MVWPANELLLLYLLPVVAGKKYSAKTVESLLELKTGIVYVQGRHYWQWHLSWRGPALLVASLLLMLYGRRRLPKKLPAISES